MTSIDSFKSKQTLTVGGKTYTYYSIVEAEKNGLEGVSKLPGSMKVVLENLLRFEDNRTVTKADIEADRPPFVDTELAPVQTPQPFLTQFFRGTGL